MQTIAKVTKPTAVEPSVAACLARARAALEALDVAAAEQHVAAGFQHALHGWWQVGGRPGGFACILGGPGGG